MRINHSPTNVRASHWHWHTCHSLVPATSSACTRHTRYQGYSKAFHAQVSVGHTLPTLPAVISRRDCIRDACRVSSRSLVAAGCWQRPPACTAAAAVAVASCGPSQTSGEGHGSSRSSSKHEMHGTCASCCRKQDVKPCKCILLGGMSCGNTTPDVARNQGAKVLERLLILIFILHTLKHIK